MTRANRRTFLKAVAAGSAAAWAGTCHTAQTSPTPPAVFFQGRFVGKMATRSSRQIDDSSLSVGFETLDRFMFDPTRCYQAVGELGVKWARCQTGWARTESNPGEYDFEWLDQVVDSLLEEGVRPWFNLGYGNRLYTPDAPDVSAVGWAPIHDEHAERAWLRYTRAIATRFADRVTHWEIWNEPNITKFWQPWQPSAIDYVKLVRLTAPVIRECVPGAVIIGGAMAGMPTDYLKGCLDAGIGQWIDRISYHPYRPVPESGYETTLEQWRHLIRQYDPRLKLWQGENGCPSAPGSAGALREYEWNETTQAKWVLRRIMTDLRLEVELTSYFHLVDLMNYNWGAGATSASNLKGLLRGDDYTPKPSYYAYQRLCALFDSQTERVPLTIDTRPSTGESETIVDGQIHRAAFSRAGRALVAYWMPATLQRGFVPQPVGLTLQLADDCRLERPVLVDPLTGDVYELQGDKQPNAWSFEGLPLTDHPLIVADAGVVGLHE